MPDAASPTEEAREAASEDARATDPRVRIFGIRHHGPGSANSLAGALGAWQPDVVLIEGPADPEAQALLPYVLRKETLPPVALLLYDPGTPKRAVFYPFTEHSPEWLAIHHAARAGVPARFIDLPVAWRFGWDGVVEARLAELQTAEEQSTLGSAGQEGEDAAPEPIPVPETVAELPTDDPADDKSLADAETVADDPRDDGLAPLARAAGYDDPERWWEHLVEQRQGNDLELFDAINEALAALRPTPSAWNLPAAETLTADDCINGPWREHLREAHMRQGVRAALAEGFTRVAVVCGAWHAPALALPAEDTTTGSKSRTTSPAEGQLPTARVDAALLKAARALAPRSLPAPGACWTPWTDGRLASASGYGAGMTSPAWYRHLWENRAADPRTVIVRWLARGAELLRERDVAISSAHIIEATRLAEALAALRGRSLPDTTDIRQAIAAVYADPFASDGFADISESGGARMLLIEREWWVGTRLGTVPADGPAPPLVQDLARQQKNLRLAPEAMPKTVEIDLRRDTDRARSFLLHRLGLLGIGWGRTERSRGTGSFRETWQLTWEPELAMHVITAGIWGSTVETAATAKALADAREGTDLAALVETLHRALLAGLDDTLPGLLARVQVLSAGTQDVSGLLIALPPLARLARYGDTRGTKLAAITEVLDGMAIRACVGLLAAASGLDDDATRAFHPRLIAAHEALDLIGRPALTRDWQEALVRLADGPGVPGLLAGTAARYLHDAGDVAATEATAGRLSRALSPASAPPVAAGWIEGFLGGSGLVLLHDTRLFGLLAEWLEVLDEDAFTAVLPLLRRAFAAFPGAERRQLGSAAAERVEGAVARASDPMPIADPGQKQADGASADGSPPAAGSKASTVSGLAQRPADAPERLLLETLAALYGLPELRLPLAGNAVDLPVALPDPVS